MNKITLKEKELVLAHSLKMQSTVVGMSRQKDLRRLVILDHQSRSRERWRLVLGLLAPYSVLAPSPHHSNLPGNSLKYLPRDLSPRLF